MNQAKKEKQNQKLNLKQKEEKYRYAMLDVMGNLLQIYILNPCGYFLMVLGSQMSS